MEKFTVLIVEDNPKNMKLMVDLMSVQGYKTMSAPDGISGLELARSRCPHIILMDVQLPRMDGYTVIKQLKEWEETKDIPVIVVTSFAMKGEEKRAREAGAADYISKPIDIHRMIEIVAKHLPGERSDADEQ